LALAPIIVALANLSNLILQVVLPPIVLFMTVLNELRAITLTLLAAQIDAVALAFKVAWDAIVATVQIAWAILKGIFDVMISLLQGDFSEAWRRLQRLVGEVWDIIKGFVSDALSKIRDYIVEWGPKLYNAAFDALKSVANVFSEKFGEFVTTAQTKITEVATKFEDIPAAVNNIFMNAGSWLYETGKNVLQGFIDGLTDTAQALYDKLQSIVNKAKEIWEGATGWITGSPSRWMETRGKWVVQGFAEGLDNNQSLAVDATQALLNVSKEPFQDPMSVPIPDIAAMMSSNTPVGATATTGTGGMSIVFGTGAVAVSFEGVVPSEADALRTGYAVGNGILDAIARRDARLAIRVM
jgi:phage-related protein